MASDGRVAAAMASQCSEKSVEGVVEYLQPKHLYPAAKVDDQSAYRLLGSQW